MDAIISHGGTEPLLMERSITRRRNGLDGGTLRYTAASEAAFSEGQFIGGLEVKECERVQDGTDYDFTLSMLGIDGSKPVRMLDGYPDITYNYTDWDRAEVAYLTNNARQITEGSVGSFGGTTVCVSANPKQIHTGWYEVRGSFLGIIRAKPRQRTITVNGAVHSPSVPIVVNLLGGWNSYAKGTFQLPRIVVQDRYFGFTSPPTGLIPGPAIPPNAPTVKVIGFNNMPVTLQWPNGWHLAAIGDEQIGDRSLHASVWTYEYVMKALPGG